MRFLEEQGSALPRPRRGADRPAAVVFDLPWAGRCRPDADMGYGLV